VFVSQKVDILFLYCVFRLTNPDGRYTNFIQKADFTAGRYKLHFDVDRYFELRKLESLYPFIEVAYIFFYWLRIWPNNRCLWWQWWIFGVLNSLIQTDTITNMVGLTLFAKVKSRYKIKLGQACIKCWKTCRI